MIEEPPVLSIKSHAARPSPEQIAAFRGQPTGFVTDAMNGVGALAAAIKPLAPEKLPFQICGPALTVDCGPRDILALLAALPEIQPGDVLVVAAGGWADSAAAGDRVCGMAKNCGAAGLVTDGMVRDIDGILGVGLPVFCAGVTPNSPYATGPGSVGLPVSLGGVRVETGDMIVTDKDGVVVVPKAEIDQVASDVARVADLENALDAEVAAGLKVPAAILELLASDRVKRL